MIVLILSWEYPYMERQSLYWNREQGLKHACPQQECHCPLSQDFKIMRCSCMAAVASGYGQWLVITCAMAVKKLSYK